jgi:septum formation protein
MLHIDVVSSPGKISASSKYILASKSPRRRQLLEWAELDFDVVFVETDERYPDGLAVEAIPVHIAQQKAQAVQLKCKLAPGDHFPVIIAADTVVVIDGAIIGKPADREEAVRILMRLSGRTHQVITGVCILGKQEISFSDTTDVQFNDLSREQIEYYIHKYQPYDKAGAYGIQEWIGVIGIKRITGDFYNVMGLPVNRVMQALKSFT